jgi:hypothetical protein
MQKIGVLALVAIMFSCASKNEQVAEEIPVPAATEATQSVADSGREISLGADKTMPEDNNASIDSAKQSNDNIKIVENIPKPKSVYPDKSANYESDGQKVVPGKMEYPQAKGEAGSAKPNNSTANNATAAESAAVAAAINMLNSERRLTYDSIRSIREVMPDSLASAKTEDERTYYNRHSFNLSSLELKLLNQMDGMNIAMLKNKAELINDIIAEFETKVKRLNMFTNTLKKITDGTGKIIQAAAFLISKGVIVPKVTPTELQAIDPN